MCLKPNPYFPFLNPRKALNLPQLLKVNSRRGLPISWILYRIILIPKHRRFRIGPKSPIVKSGRGIISHFTLEKIVVQILVHHVPGDELASVPGNDRVEPPPNGGRKLSFGEGVEPPGLVLGVVPEHVVASDQNVVSFGELDHGVRRGVVLLARCLFGAVPLHLVLEGGDGKRPRSEPVLVGLVSEDVVVYGATEGETKFVLLEGECCVR